MSIETIKINEVEYVRKDSLKESVPELNGLKYCIIRARGAGVFAGYIESSSGQEFTLLKARRLWQWAGAASLSELAQSGTKSPNSCKFPEEVNRIKVFEVIEVLDVTSKAKETLDSVKVWKA